jgi:hypothetical protein
MHFGLFVRGCSLVMLGAAACSDPGAGHETPDAGTEAPDFMVDAALSIDAPSPAFSFTPWSRSIGATVSNYAATSLVTDATGRIHLIGSAVGNEPFATITNVASFYSTAYPLIARYANDGTLESAQRPAATKLVPGVGAVAPDGAIVLVSSTVITMGPGLTDVVVRKLDASGTTISWTKALGSVKDDSGAAVAVDGNGNIFVGGTVNGAIAGQTAGLYGDAFVTKYDPSGNLLWTRQFATTTTESMTALAVDVAGNVYVAGFGATVTDPQGPHSDYYGFVRKLSSTGTTVWSKELAKGASPNVRSVAVAADGSVAVAGGVNGALTGATNAGASDVAVWKLDGNGDALWSRQFGTAGYDIASGLAFDLAGNVAVAGVVSGALPQKTHAGNSDGFVRLYSGTGTERWTEQFGSNLIDEVSAVATDGGGNAYVAGTAYAGFPGVQERGFNDAFVIKFPAQ